MPSARTQSTDAGEEWKTTWAITAASMDTWTTNNASNKGATLLWWEAAVPVTVAYNAWKLAWDAEPLDASMSETTVNQTNCDLGSGTWTTDNSAAQAATTIAECKAACTGATIAALVMNPDTTGGSNGATTTANNGGMSAPKTSAHGSAWCGAYSYNDSEGTANLKCQLMLGASSAVSADSSANVAANHCGTFAGVDSYATKQAAVVAATIPS